MKEKLVLFVFSILTVHRLSSDRYGQHSGENSRRLQYRPLGRRRSSGALAEHRVEDPLMRERFSII